MHDFPPTPEEFDELQDDEFYEDFDDATQFYAYVAARDSGKAREEARRAKWATESQNSYAIALGALLAGVLIAEGIEAVLRRY